MTGMVTFNMKQDGLVLSSVAISHINYVSRDYLISSIRCAVKAREIEDSYIKGDIDISEIQLDGTIFIRHCFISSICFLESNINEILFRIKEKEYDILSGELDKVFSIMYEKDLFGLSRMSWINKYSLVVDLLSKFDFEKGSSVYQDVVLLNELRNSIIHFVPETIVENIYFSEFAESRYVEIQKIENKFRGKIKNSVYRKNGNFINSGVMSADAAAWSVLSAIKFTEKFYELLGINDPHILIKADMLNKIRR